MWYKVYLLKKMVWMRLKVSCKVLFKKNYGKVPGKIAAATRDIKMVMSIPAIEIRDLDHL